MNLIKPKKLKKKDVIALISPSSGLANLVPHRLNNAIKFLKNQGYLIQEFQTTRTINNVNNWESSSAKKRAADIMLAFKNPQIKAIVCTIGGDTANKLLEFLDFEEIKKNPKIFMGYSDATILHHSIQSKTGLVTFYGPAALTQFGEHPKPLDYTIKNFQKAVTGNLGKVYPSKKWTDETLNWFEKEDLKRPRILLKNKGYVWLKQGNVTGRIFGGCLPSLNQLIGTSYSGDYENKILFIETCEGNHFDEKTPLPVVDSDLCDLRNKGVFKKIIGLVFGRSFKYSKNDNNILKKVILENTRDYDFPILFNFDIGHTDPQITIPLNIKIKLDSKNNSFEFLEQGVL